MSRAHDGDAGCGWDVSRRREGLQLPLYLVYLDPDPHPALAADEAFRLAPGLYLFDSEEPRSRLYHRLKRRTGSLRLAVAPLSEAPKFKGMAPGALKWVRSRREPDQSVSPPSST